MLSDIDDLAAETKLLSNNITALQAQQDTLQDKLHEQITELQDRMTELELEQENIVTWSVDPNIDLSADLQIHMQQLCKSYDVPYTIMLAIAEHESGFQVNAIGYNTNGTYDIGLFQINSVNHDWLMNDYGLDVTNPKENIESAAVMLAMFLDRHDIETAIACYAAGEYGATKLGRGKWFAETILREETT
jgi:Soluble lytic murein transglycosylase and related regulatory proteins (some contain LysM/invasin domains)